MLLPLLVFFATTLGIFGLVLWLAPTRSEVRLKALAGNADDGAWTATVVKLAGPFAKLSTPEGDWDTSPLRTKFFNAGIRHADARLFYFAAKTILPLGIGLVTLAVLARTNSAPDGLSMLLYVLITATFGCYFPNLLLHFKAKARKRAIFENFPDAVDLMLVCVEAGLGLDAALAKVTDEMRFKCLPLAEELHLTNLEIRAGGTRAQALKNLALRSGVEELRVFGVMLTQAEKFGTSIGDALRVFSDDMRHKRHARAEEKAAKIPTKMLFPLVTCIFPSIIMVILGPAVIKIIRVVLPSIAGGA